MNSTRIAGLDIGFSTTRPTAGIGLWVDNRLVLTNCHGVEACARVAAAGDYDIVAIDGPVIPEGQDIRQSRNIERVFCHGLFQRRCKPGFSHVRGTGVRLREEAGTAANLLSNSTMGSRVTSVFPHVRKGTVIEAFPNAFLGVCLDDGVYTGMPKLKRGQKFRWLYEQWKRLRLVESLPGLTLKQRQIFGEKFQQTNHHEHQAAIICILTGLLVARNQFIAVGDAQGGWFFLPPWSCWKEWARDAVCANLRQLNTVLERRVIYSLRVCDRHHRSELYAQ
jgi:hypothetical protein